MSRMMKFGFLLLALAATAAAQSDDPGPPTNVNSRYVVEAVVVPPAYLDRLSGSVRDQVQSLAGSHFDQGVFDELLGRIRRELRNRVVTMKVTRGAQPETLRVAFNISERSGESDVVVGRFVYHSKQNFSFGLEGNLRQDGHNFRFGILTDNDELVERYSGLRAGYERDRLAGGHLAFHVDVESWRAQWQPSVALALASNSEVPGIYRKRLHFEPGATVTFIEPLTLQLGVSLQRLEMQYPAARYELSGAAVGTLRFRRRWELTPGNRHEVAGSYDIRSATRTLDSDFVYTRHRFEASYGFHGRQEEITVSFQAGLLNGRAPLFERFVLGNSNTLRGWNRFDVDPLGGSRMMHGSVDYRYRFLRLVYDTGSLWRRDSDATVRHSAGVGLTGGGNTPLTALVAFPIRDGAIVPIFMLGINF